MSALFIPARFFACLVGRAELVNGVICEVHEQIVHVTRRRLPVRFSAEARETFFVNVDAQRVDTIQEYIDAQIVLEVVYKVRLV